MRRYSDGLASDLHVSTSGKSPRNSGTIDIISYKSSVFLAPMERKHLSYKASSKYKGSPSDNEKIMDSSIQETYKWERSPSQEPWYKQKELNGALLVIKKIMKMDLAKPFNTPVDPIALAIPDYFDVIDCPMDFGTICNGLEHGHKYLSSEEVFRDVQLIWDNCLKYNGKGHYIVDIMERVKKNFTKYWTAAGLCSYHGGASAETPSGEDIENSPKEKAHTKGKVAMHRKREHRRRAFLRPLQGTAKSSFKEHAGGTCLRSNWEGVRLMYNLLCNAEKELIWRAGFGECLSCPPKKVDNRYLYALVERFRPETNTFHFPMGELTLTPGEFCAITSLRFGGTPVRKVEHWGAEELYRIFKKKPESSTSKGATATFCWVKDCFLRQKSTRGDTDEDYALRRAKALLFIFIAGCLFSYSSGNRGAIGWLKYLENWDAIRSYDWGGAAYAHLFISMRSFAVGSLSGETFHPGSNILCGLSSAILYWGYEHFNYMRAQMLGNPDAFKISELPTCHFWCKIWQPGNLTNYHDLCCFFDVVTAPKVRYRPFKRFLDRPDTDRLEWFYYAAALDRRRKQFECPNGCVLYLAERVTRQWLGDWHIPHEPPTDQMTLLDRENPVDIDALTLIHPKVPGKTYFDWFKDWGKVHIKSAHRSMADLTEDPQADSDTDETAAHASVTQQSSWHKSGPTKQQAPVWGGSSPDNNDLVGHDDGRSYLGRPASDTHNDNNSTYLNIFYGGWGNSYGVLYSSLDSSQNDSRMYGGGGRNSFSAPESTPRPGSLETLPEHFWDLTTGQFLPMSVAVEGL